MSAKNLTSNANWWHPSTCKTDCDPVISVDRRKWGFAEPEFTPPTFYTCPSRLTRIYLDCHPSLYTHLKRTILVSLYELQWSFLQSFRLCFDDRCSLNSIASMSSWASNSSSDRREQRKGSPHLNLVACNIDSLSTVLLFSDASPSLTA